MPSKPLPDRRKNSALTDEEVQDRIAERHEKAKRARNQTKGGILIGSVGVIVAGYAALVQDNIWMTLLGFVMALIGFGFSSPKEAAGIVRSVLGKNRESE